MWRENKTTFDTVAIVYMCFGNRSVRGAASGEWELRSKKIIGSRNKPETAILWPKVFVDSTARKIRVGAKRNLKERKTARCGFLLVLQAKKCAGTRMSMATGKLNTCWYKG